MAEFKGYRAGLPTIKQIACRLNDKIDDVCAWLHLRGVQEANDLVCKNPTRSDKEAGSFRICTKGPAPMDGGRRGLWIDHATGEKGDAFDLVKYITGVDDIGAKEIGMQILGWNGETIPDLPHVQERPKHEQVDDKQAEREAKKKGYALSLFIGAQEKIAGTPVDLYLKGRGIDLSVLGRQPHAIRYAPACPVGNGRRCPAMICCRQRGDGTQVGVHITYLGEYDGKWTKSREVDPVKKMMGQGPGSFVPIARGNSGKPLKEADEGSSVLIAEGIETALSLSVALPEDRVLAALSVTNIKNIELPPAITDVYLCMDADESGSTARTYNQAARVFKEQGRRVFCVRPPAGFNDFNDVARASFDASSETEAENAPF